VPAAPSGFGPDTSFIPTLRRGTLFSATNGSTYMLTNDVNFADPRNETVVALVNETNGQPTEYAIRAYGEIVSGRYNVQTFKVGDFTRFRRIDLRDSNLTEVISVVDSSGREYFEVDYLSQNVIYRPVRNTGANSNSVPNLLKPFVAMRRFVIEREFGRNFLQFGYGSEENLSNEGFLNPDDIVLERHARDYITDRSFDPTKMLQSDKFGVSPSNTTLTVSYRTNDTTTVNAAVGSVIRVQNAIFKFINANKLNNGLKNKVISSLEVTNDDPIVGDVTYPSTDEIKRRIFDSFTSQHRAVTAQDYKALIYMMPSKFGSIKRCNVLQDPDAMKRNLNIVVVSEDPNGNLTKTNDTIKNNLKNWLNQYRMVNDTIDILDAKIVNIGINFTIVSQEESNKHAALRKAENALRKEFMSIGEISEALPISDIYRILNQIPGVSDTVDVTIIRKSGGAYSPVGFNVEEHMTFDGRYLIAPEDVVYEIRFLDADIQGTVR
tara:strand:- start:228 stop:1706 length:1479 start_codon:yes stop_codon:yes gene_type:complete